MRHLIRNDLREVYWPVDWPAVEARERQRLRAAWIAAFSTIRPDHIDEFLVNTFGYPGIPLTPRTGRDRTEK